MSLLITNSTNAKFYHAAGTVRLAFMKIGYKFIYYFRTMKYLILFFILSSAVFHWKLPVRSVRESLDKSVPSNLVASQITTSSANLTWTAPSDDYISRIWVTIMGLYLATSAGISTTFALSRSHS
jgi:hypothetical protein